MEKNDKEKRELYYAKDELFEMVDGLMREFSGKYGLIIDDIVHTAICHPDKTALRIEISYKV